MTTFAKIRVLLALLFSSLLLTAIIVHNNHTPEHDFVNSARLLEKNLHEKEAVAYKLLNGTKLQDIKNTHATEHEKLKFIDQYTAKENHIWITIFKNGQLYFWSGIKVLPEDEKQIHEGCSFIKQPNGYYEALKKTDGNFSTIILIPIHEDYRIQNQYLRNTFHTDLLDKGNTLAIAEFTDKDVYHIHDRNQKYLFSVKASPRINHREISGFEITLWVLSLLALCLLISNICNYLALKRKLLWACLFLGGSLVLIRFINLYFHFPDLAENVKLFSPTIFTLNGLFPSLGDLCINLLFICWLVGFIYQYRHRLFKQQLSVQTGYIVFTSSIIFLLASATGFLYLFNRLVINSNISFDVNNVLNLSAYSLLGVLMACFCFLIFYLMADIFLTINTCINIRKKAKLIIFLAAVVLATVIYAYFYEFTAFYLLLALLIIIRAHATLHYQGNLSVLAYISIIIICSLIASIKLNDFETIKEQETRISLIHQLEDGNDIDIRPVLKNIEKQILHDSFLPQYFQSPNHTPGYLEYYFRKIYFDGFLSDYNFKVHEFDSSGKPILTDKDFALDDFKEMVAMSSFKVSNYFYRENDAFGFRSYFAILPIQTRDRNLGTVIVELKSKPFADNNSFPTLLAANEVKYNTAFKDYSYAFYSDNHLLSQNGSYDYSMVNNEFQGKLKQYVFTSSYEGTASWLHILGKYSHLIYKPSQRKTIVVSRQANNTINNLASFTFFFVVLLAFSAVIIIAQWLWKRVTIVKVTRQTMYWNFQFDLNNILYKTRIQFSMIFAVGLTLVLVGGISFLAIRDQFKQQQDDLISNKVVQIAAKLGNNSLNDILHIDQQSEIKFDNIANDYSTDLTLFNRDGTPMLSTQPKIYDYGLLARRMNAKAYIQLSHMQKSVIVNAEKIGTLNYTAAYAPIRDGKNATVAFLQLPYFANEMKANERIGSLLNAMINIYALIFVAIGFFSVIIARQITTPLSVIQYSLSRTIYGKKNEPIQWKRNDEIGALVKEYNKMIAALEESATRLAQSERETAWREMAKQVAHEIKNPLTPLKLGLQLLEKSWKDKDPKFDTKFERFSKSFVEQIESLSSIASEFSAFAKMPDTRMERLNLFESLGQAVIIFKQMDNITINYQTPETPFMIRADRDQMLRCFNNLLKNAIEAMPPERLGIIDVAYTVSRNSIVLNIKDNGNGIPENLRNKIFEPNFTTKSSGTGLGLAFVKNSIENAGGKISFETEAGKGTIFHLSFPESKL
ncbi:GHKL domain-containing protein [Mucilaginibacter robiniae]|uniref:histidine kinase n=1 Tax=Mucilaginibacter robiniae TaxID=2728022 RepID=A0A7L5E0P7_9SPHI|nr:ATP-binding protein [Mucilaginibacter robiniae]QJD96805.1 GHKL domain-containing protein [Mucilaginibacter robiniae]